MSLGDNIYKLRKENKMSQEHLAEKVKVTRQTISNWELNQTQPNPEQLKLLSQILNVSIDSLLDNELDSKESVVGNCPQLIENNIVLGENSYKKNNKVIYIINIILLIACVVLITILIIRLKQPNSNSNRPAVPSTTSTAVSTSNPTVPSTTSTVASTSNPTVPSTTSTVVSTSNPTVPSTTTTVGDISSTTASQKMRYAVVYDMQNGSDLVAFTVEEGSFLYRPKIPEKEGYVFVGWFFNDTEWIFDDYDNFRVHQHIILTAKWEPMGS